jgi:hypothetical protein
MRTILERFVAWSKDHVGSPCPDFAAIGVSDHDAQDPWGHAIQLTCTDQPGDQIVGLVSAGPDGLIGTPDDVASWQLSPAATGIVHGPRWVAATTSASGSASTQSHPATKRTKPKSRHDIKLDSDGIPLQR